MAVRVAAAAIAKKWLWERHGVVIRGYMAQLGSIRIAFRTWDAVNVNPFFAPDPDIVPKLEEFMDRLRKAGDSCGAKITVVAENVAVGWGEPCFGQLDAGTAHAIVGIQPSQRGDVAPRLPARPHDGAE